MTTINTEEKKAEEEKFFQVSSTLDKYHRVSQDKEPINPFEIRIKSGKDTKFYVGYAMYLLDRNNSEMVIIKATGNAIPKAVNVVEILKRRVEGLHQINRIKHAEAEDIYEPLEEGLDTVIVKRYLSLIEITLTKDISTNGKDEAGYQEPLPEAEIQKSKALNNKTREQVKKILDEGAKKVNKTGGKGGNKKGGKDRDVKDGKDFENKRGGNKNVESSRGGRGGKKHRQRVMDRDNNKDTEDSEYQKKGTKEDRPQKTTDKRTNDHRNKDKEYQRPNNNYNRRPDNRMDNKKGRESGERFQSRRKYNSTQFRSRIRDRDESPEQQHRDTKNWDRDNYARNQDNRRWDNDRKHYGAINQRIKYQGRVHQNNYNRRVQRNRNDINNRNPQQWRGDNTRNYNQGPYRYDDYQAPMGQNPRDQRGAGGPPMQGERSFRGREGPHYRGGQDHGKEQGNQQTRNYQRPPNQGGQYQGPRDYPMDRQRAAHQNWENDRSRMADSHVRENQQGPRQRYQGNDDGMRGSRGGRGGRGAREEQGYDDRYNNNMGNNGYQPPLDRRGDAGRGRGGERGRGGRPSQEGRGENWGRDGPQGGYYNDGYQGYEGPQGYRGGGMRGRGGESEGFMPPSKARREPERSGIVTRRGGGGNPGLMRNRGGRPDMN